MAFSTVFFIFVFLPLSLLLFGAALLLKGRWRGTACKVVLLLVGLFFFAWATASYVPLLLAMALGNYWLAWTLEPPFEGKGDAGSSARKVRLATGLAVDVFVLVFFKYLGFLVESLGMLPFDIGFTAPELVQPLGISFMVFSLVSYLMDVYRGTIPAERNLLNFLVWATFFPKLVQGPIARYDEMFGSHTESEIGFTLEGVSYGARRFVFGLAKKVIIADTLGVVADAVFQTQAQSGVDTPTAWLGIICYTFQIFFDFAGYSDMAIGLAALFGFRLRENFKYPYISVTVGEFWRRWHISLSTWLRDYLYFPLGGSRRGNVYVNLAIVFLVSGLWHGASWHFVFWGAWYALFMILDRLYRKLPVAYRLPKPITWAFTLLVVVFGWVLFRATGTTQALQYWGTMLGFCGSDTQFFSFWYYCNARLMFVLVLAAVCSTPLFETLGKRFGETLAWRLFRTAGVPLLFVLTLTFVAGNTYTPFLYAQF